MSLTVSFMYYNGCMYWKEYGHTSPYRINKRMRQAPTEDMYIYSYQNEQCPHGYENIEVTKEQLDILIAEDRKEYSNNRRHDEKHTDLWEDYHDAFEEEPEEDDNGGVRYFSPKKVAAMVRRQWQQSDDFMTGELDRRELLKTFDDRDLAIYSLAVEKKIKQNKVADLLNLSEATVSRRVKVILQKIIKEDMDFGIYSKSRLDAEADYKYYRISGETDSFADVKVWLFLTQLNRDMVIRYLTVCSVRTSFFIIVIYFYIALPIEWRSWI